LTYEFCRELEDLNAMKVWTAGKETGDEGLREREIERERKRTILIRTHANYTKGLCHKVFILWAMI